MAISWLDVQDGQEAKQVQRSSHSEMEECNSGLFAKEKGVEERLPRHESSAASRPGAPTSAPAISPLNMIQVNSFTPSGEGSSGLPPCKMLCLLDCTYALWSRLTSTNPLS